MSFAHRHLQAFIIMAVILTNIASANDSSFGDRNGSIILLEQPDISMDSESLLISEKLIQVEYIFTNSSNKDLTIPMVFPMPPMFFGDMDHNEISDFKLWVDGKPIKSTRKLVILLDQKIDITSEVKKLHWNEADLISFLTDHALPKGKASLPDEWFDENIEPRFTLNEYFIWSQKFVSGKSLRVRHSYVPSLSSGVPRPSSDLIKYYGDLVCLDESAKAGIKRREREYGVAWSKLEYIIVTANNWQGPIKDFHLSIKKSHPSDMISLCMDSGLKKSDALTFEFHQKNFIPKHDLNILFVRSSF